MKAIHADPKEIRKIFAEKYVIPDFQRPYSWEIEHCDKFWDDLINFISEKESRDDKYFLGNIVIHQNGDGFVVIDGQQRLTSLLLLIKALHNRAGIVRALEECIKIKNPLTSELTDELRVNSNVLEKDKEYLYDIIFNEGNRTPDTSNIKINYKFFNEKINEWWLKEHQSPDKLNDLILSLLDQVVILPIHCGSEDDALTIFETINNRGMSLSDADIFKAKLHQSAKNEKDIFIKKWNEIDRHEWLFRIYMHICRAKDGDYGKEIALRSYFTTKNRLSEWKPVMETLSLIYDIQTNWTPSNDVVILWYILETYPNYYWNYPLFVFLNKYGKMEDGNYVLPENLMSDFTILLKETLIYFFIKGVVYNSVNAVKDTVFRVCSLIEKKSDYLGEYKKNLSNDFEEFEKRLNNNQFGRYLKGIVLLSAYLNPNQSKSEFERVITNNYHIEHILPKKWNNYDNWSQDTWEININALGNLIPLEWNLNISAKNEFFDRKKDSYSKSSVQDALDLVPIKDWYPDNLNNKTSEKIKRLMDFFK